MKTPISLILVLVTALVATANPRCSFAGAPPPTTVLTHGYQWSGTVPDWVYALADAIAHRAGDETGTDGRVLVYRGFDGALEPCEEPWCTADGDGHTVIVFDWADDSNESNPGFSEAAAESLFAGLVGWSAADAAVVDLARLHLIGHSRGAVVNSEVAERLIAAGLPAPIQVTSLDPHDAGGAFVAQGVPEGGLDDYDVNQEHPEYDCHSETSTPGVCAWQDSGYHDNYWQNSPGCFFLLPRGVELFGAANFQQNGLDSPFCHSDTHHWYYFTVDTAAATHPVTLDPPGPAWFGSELQCSESPRVEPLARSADGYNLTAAAGGQGDRCPSGPGVRQQVLFEFGLQEGLVNGDFERTREVGQTQPGWSFHGGAFDADLGFDGDAHLVLAAGDSVLHNRFWLPENAWAIELCKRVAVASAADLLSLELLREGAPDRQLLSPEQQQIAATTDWSCVSAPLHTEEPGRVAQLRLSLTGLETPEVWVDDLRLVIAIFADGFESGDSGSWTSTVP